MDDFPSYVWPPSWPLISSPHDVREENERSRSLSLFSLSLIAGAALRAGRADAPVGEQEGMVEPSSLRDGHETTEVSLSLSISLLSHFWGRISQRPAKPYLPIGEWQDHSPFIAIFQKPLEYKRSERMIAQQSKAFVSKTQKI